MEVAVFSACSCEDQPMMGSRFSVYGVTSSGDSMRRLRATVCCILRILTSKPFKLKALSLAASPNPKTQRFHTKLALTVYVAALEAQYPF